MSENPLVRVMALHALAYCERLFYLEEVEEIRVADEAVYAGRALHEELARTGEEKGQWRTMEFADEELGLVGKVDCLQYRDGFLVPFEHKRGRPRRLGREAVAWPSDALQVCAYAMLLEKEMGRAVPEGRVRYHAENVTVRVPVDERMRCAVYEAVARARELCASTERPPVTDNDRLCIRCSLAPVCLPEEERLATDPGWNALRLFPPGREGRIIHVIEPSARVSRAGETLRITTAGKEDTIFPIREVEALVLHGYPQVTTQAIHFCARYGIPLHYISSGGWYVACSAPGVGGVQRRIRQYQALVEPGTRLKLARKLAMAKVEGCLRYLLRATRGRDRRALGLDEPVRVMRSSLSGIARAEGTDIIRGHEGTAGRAWFSVLPILLSENVAPELKPLGRSRRPPRDRFNALLGFGYALVYQAVLQATLVVGLEPAFGFYHTPRSSAHPLVLDLMELFRLPLWDIPLIGSVNRSHWDAKEDFCVTKGRVWLSPNGRRKAVTLFEKRLENKWRHPVIGYSISYGRMIELEARLLEKEWAGSPGLFARMRLR